MLGLLQGRRADAPDRHQALQDAIAWSYDLLAPPEQALFRRLSVFVGGCTLEAAQAVVDLNLAIPAVEDDGAQDVRNLHPPTPDMLNGLSSLLDKSLLYQEPQADGEPRLRLLETIREFGLEQLVQDGEGTLIHRRHAHFFLYLACAIEPHLQGWTQERWLDQLEQEQGNLRAALRWAVEHQEGALGLRLSAALAQFWYKRGFWTEGRQWLETFLKLRTTSQQTSLDAKALYSLGLMVICTGSCADAHAVLERCLGVSLGVEAMDWSARALAMLGTLAHRLGHHKEGQRFFSASVKHFEALDDHWGIVTTLSRRAYNAFLAGIDSVLDKAAFQRSLTPFHPAGDTAYTAHIVKSLGTECYYQGRYGEARTLLEESLELSRRGEFVSHTASELALLSMIEVAQGDLETATKHLHESITLLMTAGHRFAIAEAFDAFSVLAFARQEPAQALRFGGAAAAVRAAIGVRPFPVAQSRLDGIYASARSQLNAAEADTAWAAGATMTLDGAAAYALAR